MHLWTLTKWKKIYTDSNVISGLRLRCDKDVHPEVKRACKEFCDWLRSEFHFPIRVTIYLKSSKVIKAMDGELVYGTFLGPYDKLEQPYIRVATGDFLDLQDSWGKDDALASYLFSIAHELSHYYQWINDLKLTPIGMERQANKYQESIVYEYSAIREHP